METEWCFLPERSEVMINVTDIYGEQLDKVLAEIEETYTWTGVTFETAKMADEVTEWMFLLRATTRPA